jgi:5-methylcytosine-specific restriction endonuclease McrA
VSKVFVLDTQKRPLDPVHPGRARLLLKEGKAAIFRRYPFTIIRKATGSAAPPQPLRVKIDPGSKTTGLALVNDQTGEVVWAGEIAHRGGAIRHALLARRARRRSRRTRKTRHRAPRFLNRRRPEGWLPPSLESRVTNVVTWAERLRRAAPIGAISLEVVCFDTQALQNPQISGVAYQQGELLGYEVRAYLLEKWGRACAYCGARNVPLQVEHIVPRARGGSDRVSNLTLACAPCNERKGTQTAAEFGFPLVQAQAKAPLTDAAAVNATRWALYRRLLAHGLPVETGTGGRTQWNRTRRGLPKTHWLDAACVGASTPQTLRVAGVRPLEITALGHGSRQLCRTDRYGFPTRHCARAKRSFGMRTGDIVRAVQPRGTYTGTHVGRVTIRQRPSFRVNGHDFHPRLLTMLQRADGYDYTPGVRA